MRPRIGARPRLPSRYVTAAAEGSLPSALAYFCPQALACSCLQASPEGFSLREPDGPPEESWVWFPVQGELLAGPLAWLPVQDEPPAELLVWSPVQGDLPAGLLAWFPVQDEPPAELLAAFPEQGGWPAVLLVSLLEALRCVEMAPIRREPAPQGE